MLKKIVIKLGIIVSAILGIILTMMTSEDGFMSGPSLLLYFTIQSNIWMLAIVSLGIYFDLTKREVKQSYYVAKYILTTGILLTYLVFSVLLSPTMPLSYLLSPSNLFLHTLTPILSMLDYLLNDKKVELKGQMFYGLITPGYYLIFAYILYGFGVKFGGLNFPYFFLDFETNGWFELTSTSIGVIYWYVIVFGIMLLISYCTKLFKHRLNKYIPLYVTTGMILLTIVTTVIRALLP